MDILHLDIKSMMLMCVFIGVLITGGLAALLRDRYVCPGMHHWVSGFCILTMGVFFAVGRAFYPLWVSLLFGNLFSFLGANLLWLGLLKYNQRIKTRHYGVIGISVLTVVVLLFMLKMGLTEIKRAELVSVVFNLQGILCAREAFRDRAKYESGRLMFGLTCILVIIGSCLRFLTYRYDESYSLLTTNISNLLLIFNAIIVFLGLSFSIMLITSQWLQQKLAVFAAYDSLTGIYNRHGLNEQTTALFDPRKKRMFSHFCVAMIDIDYFKKTNDDHGHHVGDLVLKEVAAKLRENIRHNDILARYGGEEFIVVLPAMSQQDTLNWAERVCKEIAQQPIYVNGLMISVTISVGLAEILSTAKYSLDDAIKKADTALYQAKESGRNRVCCFS
jgi:diguanylate cyclase (GGDEF) domain